MYNHVVFAYGIIVTNKVPKNTTFVALRNGLQFLRISLETDMLIFGKFVILASAQL